MTADAKALLHLCEPLGEARRIEVTDLARFLPACEGDARWERIIADPTPRPKLEAFLHAPRGGR